MSKRYKIIFPLVQHLMTCINISFVVYYHAGHMFSLFEVNFLSVICVLIFVPVLFDSTIAIKPWKWPCVSTTYGKIVNRLRIRTFPYLLCWFHENSDHVKTWTEDVSQPLFFFCQIVKSSTRLNFLFCLVFLFLHGRECILTRIFSL